MYAALARTAEARKSLTLVQMLDGTEEVWRRLESASPEFQVWNSVR